jgi:hypothetical protein
VTEDELRMRAIDRARGCDHFVVQLLPGHESAIEIEPACSIKHDAVQRLNVQMPENRHQQ